MCRGLPACTGSYGIHIAHGVWVPEFILEQPEVLRNVHYEFIHAGTDVTKAFEV